MYSMRQILRLQWTTNWKRKERSGDDDTCGYLWGSERIKHPPPDRLTRRWPTGFNGLQDVRIFFIWFSRKFFLLDRRGFLGFLQFISCIFSSWIGEVFWVFIVWKFLCFLVFSFERLGFFRKSWNRWGSRIFETNISVRGASVTPGRVHTRKETSKA